MFPEIARMMMGFTTLKPLAMSTIINKGMRVL